jgi:hypothetical protein
MIPLENACRFGVRHIVAGIVAMVILGIHVASADSCGQSLGKPEVNVHIDRRPVAQDFRQTLKAMNSDPQFSLTGRSKSASDYTIGLTRLVTGYQLRAELIGQPRTGGDYCWSVATLDVLVSAETTVFIGKEVPRNSCTWREVMAHETLHVELDERLLARLADRIRPSIAKAATLTLAAPSAEQAEQAIRGPISAAAAAALEDFSQKRLAQQLMIDTPEEYRRLSMACGNKEFSEILRRAGVVE